MTKANVYMKDGTMKVPIESLEDYLLDNADKVETRPHAVRRPRRTENLD
jgi:hypothetical protein